MSIQKKSLVSTLKTTRKANLIKDENAGTVAPASKAPSARTPAARTPAARTPAARTPARRM